MKQIPFKKFILVPDKASNAALRVLDSDIMATVTANACRPESTVDVHLNIANSVNIDDLFTIVLAIRPYCAGTCNEQAIADSWLSTKAVLSGELSQKAKSVQITDISGKMLFESISRWKDGILVNKFSSGLYIILVVMTDRSVQNLKMVVERYLVRRLFKP